MLRMKNEDCPACNAIDQLDDLLRVVVMSCQPTATLLCHDADACDLDESGHDRLRCQFKRYRANVVDLASIVLEMRESCGGTDAWPNKPAVSDDVLDELERIRFAVEFDRRHDKREGVAS